MCGRFTQHLSWDELHWLAGLIGQPRNLALRYSIAPTTRIEVIRPAAGGNELVPMRWLVPAWWKKPISASLAPLGGISGEDVKCQLG
ncbi:SOS response-associated peptidase family protein [Methylocystis sp. B8]|uniref:SOS response-associated peptidase family protein n=1 Tax=Methylocystis sp. B8 TaxID=544938 RepID=UPI0010FE8BDB|nr:SOS response-associated peptidase family protein [Methylocystis sp. B8]TLG77794.1 SOS response-associated peptidase [Methylocystis sp. B8]